MQHLSETGMPDEDAQRISVAYLIPLTEPEAKAEIGQWTARLFYRKWVIVATVIVAVAIAVIYAATAPRVYRVETSLEPVRAQGMRAEGVSALLGADVGAMLGGNVADRTNVALSLLDSNEFLTQFIARRQLLPKLFPPRWFDGLLPWHRSTPTLWSGANRFRNRVLQVNENKKTGLIEISIDWPDPTYAADMLTSLVEEVNERLRERQIRETQRSIDYLKDELAGATTLEVRQAIAKVLESRLSDASLVGTKEDFALKFVARPAIPPPNEFVSPGLARAGALAVILGLLVGTLISYGLYLLVQRRQQLLAD